MSNFLSDYKSISKNSDISYRVDIKRKRLYVPKKWHNKRISINAQGAIIECKEGALVNAQGFASIAKCSASDISKIAQAVSAYNKRK